MESPPDPPGRVLVGYRCTTEKWARVLDGVGASASYRNRWNEHGQNVVYAASSRALAILELRIHAPSGPPASAVISVIRLTIASSQLSWIDTTSLPSDWRNNVRSCQLRASRWFQQQHEKLTLLVPSTVVPRERNYVIRGSIPEAQVISVEPLDLDLRLWQTYRVDAGKVETLLA